MPSIREIFGFAGFVAIVAAIIFFVTISSQKTQQKFFISLFMLCGVVLLSSGLREYFTSDFGPHRGKGGQPDYFYQEIGGGLALIGSVLYGVMKTRRKPNKALVPTPASVTDRAGARSAPDAGAAHL